MTGSSITTNTSAYERMSGGCTERVAKEIVKTLSPPVDAHSYVLDNACGTGFVSQQIKLQCPDSNIMAVDVNPRMLEQVQQRIQSESWINVQTAEWNHESMPSLYDGSFSQVIMNFGIMPTGPDAGIKAIREIYRVLRPGGVAVVSTWADRVWTTAFSNAARKVRPNEDPKNALTVPSEYLFGSWIIRQMEMGGFGNNVELRPFTTYTSASTLDMLVENMMLAKGMVFAGYSDLETEEAGRVLKSELQNLRTFEQFEGGVKIGMKAWIATGWKKGDEGEVPV